MVISYQWPKLGLGLDVEAEIQILKVIYYVPVSRKSEVYAEFIVSLYLEPEICHFL